MEGRLRASLLYTCTFVQVVMLPIYGMLLVSLAMRQVYLNNLEDTNEQENV